jgi:ABC-type amino acid transport substrate-binding protein
MNTITKGVLKICTYSGFAPVCSVRQDGRTPWGTDISFLNKFAAKHSLDTEWTVLDKFEGIWQLPGHEPALYDIAAAGITETADRKLKSPGVVWSNEYFHVQRSFLIRKADEGTFHTIYDFEGKTIAVTEDSTADLDFRVRHPKEFEVVYPPVQFKAVDDLLEGKIDAFGEGDVSNEYLAALHPGQLTVIDKHDMTEGKSEPFSFPVRRDSDILATLNRWLSETKAGYLDIPELKH